jgi:hypothetical protein
MIVSKKRGFIFLRVSKTASTSLSSFILQTIPEDIDTHTGLGVPLESAERTRLHHISLQEAVDEKYLTEDEIAPMRVYAVARDPVDRFISFANTVRPHDKFPRMHNEDKVRFLLDGFSEGLRVDLQIKWFYHHGKMISHPMIYPDFSLFLRNELGAAELPLWENSHQRIVKKIDINNYLQSRIRDLFPEDQALWESLQPRKGSGKGKTRPPREASPRREKSI